MVLSALLAAVAAAPPAVAVERASGRVAVGRPGEVLVLADDLHRPVAALPAPPGLVELVEFVGGVVVYDFLLPEDGSPGRAAVGVEDGRERLIWPNRGIGEIFPSRHARLTSDGQGIWEYLRLEARLREELGLADDIPDGAGTVVTYRFADERVWAIAAADFAGAVALAPGDALVVTSGGELLRYRALQGVVWRRAGEGEPAVISDVDLDMGAAVLVGQRAVEVVGVAGGESQGSWRRSGVAGARLLADGRLLAATQEGEVWVVTVAAGAARALPFAQLAGGQWPANAVPCRQGSGPLACLHPAPGGVVVPGDGGWRLLPLPDSAGQGSAPPGRWPGDAPKHLW
jgi:hypothetical protein